MTVVSMPEYASWRAMKTRCLNPNHKYYSRYGGSGIRIHKRWINSFENFLIDMGKKPSRQHTIDRINNSKGYEPGNCRWSTKKEQSRNRRDNTFYTYKGRTMCAVAWAEELGMNYCTFIQRIQYRGWSISKAIETPAQKYVRRSR